MFVLSVKRPFIDKTDKTKTYKVGEKLETAEVDRVNDLVGRGLCVIESVKAKGSKSSGKDAKSAEADPNPGIGDNNE